MPGRYFFATISQLERRVRLLRAEIPRDLPREYDVLSRNCGDRIDRLLEELRLLRDGEKYQHPNVQRERTRALQRVISDMDILEAVGIAALTRRGVDDDYLNQVMSQIRREITYPLIVPVVTSLSQQYFCIYTELNLLTVPLVEGRYFIFQTSTMSWDIHCLWYVTTRRLNHFKNGSWRRWHGFGATFRLKLIA